MSLIKNVLIKLLIFIFFMKVDMSIQQHVEGHYEAVGPMEFSNLTEIQKAVGGDSGFSFLSKELLKTYQYLKELPIEHMRLKTPIGSQGQNTEYIR